jgi:hypothetical protein
MIIWMQDRAKQMSNKMKNGYCKVQNMVHIQTIQNTKHNKTRQNKTKQNTTQHNTKQPNTKLNKSSFFTSNNIQNKTKIDLLCKHGNNPQSHVCVFIHSCMDYTAFVIAIATAVATTAVATIFDGTVDSTKIMSGRRKS